MAVDLTEIVVIGVSKRALFNLENDEKPLSKSHLKKIAKLFKVAEKELVVIWLADKILNTIHDEENKQQALQLALNTLTKS